MATPSVEEVLADQATDGSASVATAAGTAVGDLLIVLGVSDFYTLADFGPPSPGTWTLLESAGPDDDVHLRVWARLVDTGGANTVSLASIADEDVGMYVYRLRGVHQVAPVDDSASTYTAVAAFEHAAPSVSPASVDALLICLWATGNGQYSTLPAGMTGRTAVDGDPFYEGQAADEALSASGATGTRTATYNASRAWSAASIAVQAAAAGGGPVALDGEAAAASSAAGAASVTRPVSGTSSAADGAGGGLSTIRAYTGSSPAASSATGTATVARRLAGSGAAATSGAGALAAGRPLTGTAPAAASGRGELAAEVMPGVLVASAPAARLSASSRTAQLAAAAPTADLTT